MRATEQVFFDAFDFNRVSIDLTDTRVFRNTGAFPGPVNKSFFRFDDGDAIDFIDHFHQTDALNTTLCKRTITITFDFGADPNKRIPHDGMIVFANFLVWRKPGVFHIT